MNIDVIGVAISTRGLGGASLSAKNDSDPTV